MFKFSPDCDIPLEPKLLPGTPADYLAWPKHHVFLELPIHLCSYHPACTGRADNAAGLCGCTGHYDGVNRG